MVARTLQESTSERNWRLAREEREHVERRSQPRPRGREVSGKSPFQDDSQYAIYMLDPEGNINSWNSGAEGFSGQNPKAVVGEHFSRLYTSEDQLAQWPVRALEIATQKGRLEDEGWRLREDGSRFWAHVVIDLIKNDDGKPVGFAKVIRDVSKRRATELRLQDLHTANRELEQFIHIASHDLREPLRKLQSFNSLLISEEGDSLSEQARAYLDNMMSATQRMQELLSSLLTLTRVTSQGQAFKPTDLNAVLDDVCNDLAVLINESQCAVHVGELGQVEGDRAQLRQLFQNLISNAVKYARENVAPVVHINQVPALSPGQLCILVQDNGIGFAPEHNEKIFGIFQRLHGRDKFPGAGVGLSICRKICERHGGCITAQSQPGEGACFTVALALQANDEVSHA